MTSPPLAVSPVADGTDPALKLRSLDRNRSTDDRCSVGLRGSGSGSMLKRRALVLFLLLAGIRQYHPTPRVLLFLGFGNSLERGLVGPLLSCRAVRRMRIILGFIVAGALVT